jgi:hypothetical protein
MRRTEAVPVLAPVKAGAAVNAAVIAAGVMSVTSPADAKKKGGGIASRLLPVERMD